MDEEKFINVKIHKPVNGYVYFLGNKANNLVKIGITNHISKRINALKLSSPVELVLKQCLYVDNIMICETMLHDHFMEYRRHGEWFEIDADMINKAVAKLFPGIAPPKQKASYIDRKDYNKLKGILSDFKRNKTLSPGLYAAE